MKKAILLFSLFLLIGCKSKSVVKNPEESSVIKLALSEVDQNKITKAYDLGKRVLMTCNTSKFKPFNESEATASVIQNTSQTRLTRTCLKFRLRYGAFKDIELREIYKNRSTNSIVFRYKANYEKKIANKELRVTLNEENQVSSIKSLDWVDSF